MEQKTIKLISMLLVVLILCANSFTLISCAADAFKSATELESQGASTNNQNVEVDVYYAGGQHSKTIDLSSEEEKLYVKVGMKSVGYLEDLKIDFSDCNFVVKADEANSGMIQSIDKNSVILNRIIANDVGEIEIALNIKPKTDNVINANNFNKDNEIKITGVYTGKNAKPKDINKEMFIHTSWHAEAESEVNVKTEKYISVNDGEDAKTLLQAEVTTSVKDSALPAKQTEVEFDVPSIANTKPENVLVYAKSTESTNGDKKAIAFTSQNYNYNQETGKVKITVSNNADQEGKITWAKNAADIYEIVMIYPQIESATSIVELKANVAHTYYNDVDASSTATQSSRTQVAKTGKLLDYEMATTEKVAKGYMYSNKLATDDNKNETVYTEKYTVGTSYAKITEEINIAQNEASFINEEESSATNYIYNKKIKINKAEFDKYLGENGKIEILSNGQVIATIDNKIEANEAGMLEANISEANTNTIEIKTSKPQVEGDFTIEVERAIGKDINYSLDEIQTYTGLKTTTAVSEQEKNATMKLEEPTSKASLSINKDTLSTVLDNDVEIAVTLETDSKDDMLYTNPELTIKLPSYIAEVNNFRVEPLYADEIQIVETTINDGENGKELYIKMDGTQTKYNDDITKGMKVLLYATLVVDEETPTTTENIDITYTNNGVEVKTISKSINFVAPEKEEETTQDPGDASLRGPNQTATVDPSVEATISSIDVENGGTITKGQKVTFNIDVKNISDEDLKDIKVSIPNPEGMELGMAYVWLVENKEKNTIETEIEEIKANETATVEIIYTATEEANAKIQANVTADNTTISTNEYNVIIEEGTIALINDTYTISEKLAKADLTIENLGQDEINKLNISYYLPEGCIYKSYTGLDDIEHSVEYDEQNNIVNITLKDMQQNDFKEIIISFEIESESEEYITIAKSTFNNKEYKSNICKLEVVKIDCDINAQSLSKQFLNTGDEIVNVYTIKNTGDKVLYDINLAYEIPQGTKLVSGIITKDTNDLERTEKDGKLNYVITMLEPNEEMKFTIKLKVDMEQTSEEQEILSILNVTSDMLKDRSSTISYIVNAVEESDKDDYKIAGKIWLDANNNGKYDDGETIFEGTRVLLIKQSTGDIIKEIKTDKNGKYSFTKLENGNYLVAFLYDTENYIITEYNKTDVSEILNSDAVDGTIKYNGTDTKVALTDVLKVEDANINNIDLGLCEASKFDLALEKYINKITVNNGSGVKTYSYENEPKTLAKIDIKAKQMVGSTVIIEYKIVVKNEGNVAGYAKKIIDYIPDDMKFNSELNSQAYQGTDGKIYIEELNNTIINPGESKEVTLVLTKTMTSENMGTVVNEAEIAASYNEKGLKDINSEESNKNEKENDLGVASAIITVQTGQVAIYTTLIVAVIAILFTGLYLIKKYVVKD